MKEKEESKKTGLKLDSKNKDHGILSHQFMLNRCGNNGNSDRLFGREWGVGGGGAKITAE